ncbi:MAG: hypothetical protein IJP41_04435, partial [Synergistaceae bacterium]|nr:hypothetical protein [Synergistaceae bacterium]
MYIYSGDYGINGSINVSDTTPRSLKIYGGFVDTDTDMTKREHQSKITATFANYDNVINIEAPDNANLDFVFDGFYISSNNNYAINGIYITPNNNSTINARIENCTITAMKYNGIYAGMYGTVNTVVTNCTLNNNITSG